MHFDTLDKALDYVCTIMDIPKRTWIRNSDVFTDFLRQRRIEDYYGAHATEIYGER